MISKTKSQAVKLCHRRITRLEQRIRELELDAARDRQKTEEFKSFVLSSLVLLNERVIQRR